MVMHMGNTIDDVVINEEDYNRIMQRQMRKEGNLQLTSVVTLSPDLMSFLQPL